MAVITLYQHGIKAGVPPLRSEHKRAKRKQVRGWTAKSARSNREFLWSVVFPELTGLGHSVTLTVRTCPPTAADWDRLRDRWLKRLRRGGMIRFHWLTEWQARGVPHLHGVVFFPSPGTDREFALQQRLIQDAWVEVCAEAGADRLSQDTKPMSDISGWWQYLGKHASRGAKHYQRAGDTVPPAWRGSVGKMWGKGGKWPTREGMRLELADGGFYELRRGVRAYRRAQARDSGNGREIVAARRMLKCNVQEEAEVRGFSCWMPEEVQLRLHFWVQGLGHAILG